MSELRRHDRQTGVHAIELLARTSRFWPSYSELIDALRTGRELTPPSERVEVIPIMDGFEQKLRELRERLASRPAAKVEDALQSGAPIAARTLVVDPNEVREKRARAREAREALQKQQTTKSETKRGRKRA